MHASYPISLTASPMTLRYNPMEIAKASKLLQVSVTSVKVTKPGRNPWQFALPSVSLLADYAVGRVCFWTAFAAI